MAPVIGSAGHESSGPRRAREAAAAAKLKVASGRAREVISNEDLACWHEEDEGHAVIEEETAVVFSAELRDSSSSGDGCETAVESEQPLGRGTLTALFPELLLLNKEERSFVLKVRVLTLLDSWIGGISSIAGTEHLISLCHGSMELLARHNAMLGSTNSLLAAFLAPVMCSLADQFGRVKLLSFGRCPL